MKKILRPVIVIFAVLLLLLVLLPFLFRGRLTEALKQQINKELQATVDFGDTDLSFFRSFPSLNLGIDNLSIVNQAPFEGDTLFYAERVDLDMPIKTLFSGSVAPYTIDHFRIREAYVRLVSDEQGRVNYDIAKEDPGTGNTSSPAEEGPGKGLTLKAYELEDIRLIYEDRKEGLYVELDSLYHRGTGDLSAQKTVLSTETSGLFTMSYGGTDYLKRNVFDWKADMELDLEILSFVFKENTAHINRLPLVFDGGIALLETGTDFDLRFETPSTDFRQFLSLIPEKYSGDLAGIEASGSFTFRGNVSGLLGEETIPQFSVQMGADNASFKYTSMPLSMEEISLRGELGNASGVAEDTFLRLDTLHFNLAGDRLDMQVLAEKLGGNPRVRLQASGVLNLGNFSKLMPAGTLKDLQGIVDMEVFSSFDMQAVERQAYEQIDVRGDLRLKGVRFGSDYLPQDVMVEEAFLRVTNTSMNVEKARVRTGTSDLELNGVLTNYLNVLSDDGVVRGKLDLRSDKLVVADFMDMEQEGAQEGGTGAEDKDPAANPGESSSDEGLFPAFMNLEINGAAQEVVYDNMTLKQARAKMMLADQDLRITELSSGLFGGRVAMNGLVKGQTLQPVYDVSLKASEFDFASAFSKMEVLKNLAPVARIFEGELNGTINLAGILDKDMHPVWSSLAGELLGQLKVEQVKKNELGMVNSLNEKLAFVDLGELAGKELKAALDFADGQVRLRPLDVNVKGMHAVISGGHYFDGNMDYTLTIDVPASYLGKDVSSLAGKLNIKDFEKRTVPVDVKIGGALNSPSFTTNLDKSVENFIAQLSREKTEELTKKGTDELGNLVNKVLGQNDGAGTGAVADSTKTATSAEKDAVKEAAGNILNSLFNKKKKDTTQNRN
ncbi:AsmA family protein [Robertkochia flava]|uniref:AsmA family protein n=1 Tax=Robertkochia flava TaxID=3447986 RepID=UPI001CCD486F|nr:AsmA-like C-terminal region-containing protein [Robertkochia marina]